jgi:hypothetical protein
LIIVEVDLVWVCRIRVGDEELVGGEGHLVQTKLFPLLLDPCRQPSWNIEKLTFLDERSVSQKISQPSCNMDKPLFKESFIHFGLKVKAAIQEYKLSALWIRKNGKTWNKEQ